MTERAGTAFGLFVLLFVAFAMLRGGSSADALSADMVALGAVPILGWAVWRLLHRPRSPSWRWPTLVLLGAVGLVILQLVPLPPEVWARLPGRQTALDGYRASGLALPWMPISLTPFASWVCLLGLVAPAAVFLAVLTLDSTSRRRLATMVVVVAIGSVVLGTLQLAGGAESPFRIYGFTDTTAAVGFFANRNHQGVFLAACLPLAALIGGSYSDERNVPPFWMALSFAAALILIVGIAVAKSRAGVLLGAPAALGALAVALRARGAFWGRGWAPAASVGGAIVLGAALVALFNIGPLAERFQSELGSDLRFELVPVVARAGLDFAPIGSGVGSFSLVYQMYETPDRMMATFVNHAHNDYLEVWLECGWPGLALIAAFMGWWATMSWRAGGRTSSGEASLALAASLVVGLLLVHSTVDYPLRSPGLAVLFALCCGLLTTPPGRARQTQGRS